MFGIALVSVGEVDEGKVVPATMSELFLENPSGFKPQVGTADVLMITCIGTQEFSMTENNRSNLHADRKDNGTWRCHITHVETTSESEVPRRVEKLLDFPDLHVSQDTSGL